MVWAHFPSSSCSSSIMPLTSVDYFQNLSHVMLLVIWFQDWRVCCYNLLDCPDPKPVCWHAKGKTPRSEMTVSIEVFSMQLYFCWPSTLCICTVVTVYFCGEMGPQHYLTLLSSATGSNIGTVFATDMDEKDTLNSRLRFQIQSQEPGFPSNNLFYIQQDTGDLQLSGRSLSKRDSAMYFLKVLVTDSSM